MRLVRWTNIAISAVVLLLVAMPTYGQAVANRQALMRQARGAYYNLRNEGMVSFQCTIVPNWDLLLADEKKQNPDAAAAALAKLNQLHFVVSMAPDGSVKITHNDLPGESDKMKAALAQIYSGMEQMTTGFFDTWKLFVLDPPFPEVGSDYQIEDKGTRYRLTYKEGAADVVTMMDKQFAVQDLSVTTASFDSTIRPSFADSGKGFLLNGYDATYNSGDAAEATQLKVGIGYQDVDGLQMLQKLDLSGTYGGSAFTVQLTYSDCQVTKK